MRRFSIVCQITSLVIAACFCAVSSAAVDPTSGARMAVASAQNLLASPPLPSLENGGQTTISPMIGYTIAKTDSSLVDQSTQNGYDYTGTLTGVSAGVGITWPTRGRIGWFGLLTGSSLQGDIQINPNTENTITLDDLKSQVLAVAAGISMRIYGESSSPFAVGVFAGPAYMTVRSSFSVAIANNTGQGLDYELDTNIYGLYTGLQVKLRLGKVLINPYVLYFADASDKCRAFQQGNVSGFSQECTGNSLAMTASFPAYGLFLGYKRLRLNVFSQPIGSDDYKDIKVTNYALSYGWDI